MAYRGGCREGHSDEWQRADEPHVVASGGRPEANGAFRQPNGAGLVGLAGKYLKTLAPSRRVITAGEGLVGVDDVDDGRVQMGSAQVEGKHWRDV